MVVSLQGVGLLWRSGECPEIGIECGVRAFLGHFQQVYGLTCSHVVGTPEKRLCGVVGTEGFAAEVVECLQ